MRTESQATIYTVTSLQTTGKRHKEYKQNETGMGIRGYFSLKPGAGKALPDGVWVAAYGMSGAGNRKCTQTKAVAFSGF